MSTAMTAIKSREALSCAAVAFMVCSEKRTPPAKKHLNDQRGPRRQENENTEEQESGEEWKQGK